MVSPLSDVSVIELSTMVAGPYAGQMLGDLGADVVKIERPGKGELARHIEPHVGGETGESFYYLTANRNKRSLALDVTATEGRKLFLDLVESADVVIVNFPPTFTEACDIDYETVHERNSDVVYCAISAYGDSGPYREYPGIDTTIQAMAGAVSMTRDGESGPMRSGVPMNDVFAALYAVQGILVALRNRDRTGEGDFVDVSLLDSGLAGLTTRATYSFATGEPYPPVGRRHNYFAPEGLYDAADGTIQLSVVSDSHWKSFCEAINSPDLVNDERFATVNERVENHAALDDAIEEILAKWPADELVAVLREARVPVTAVNDTLSAFEEPQARAREMRRTIEHPTAGEVDAIGFPVKYGTIQPRIERHPPLLGEHSREVLTELDLDEHSVDRLLNEDVISYPEE